MEDKRLSATEEPEITPEMMEAGLNAYSLFEFADRGEWVVSAIYVAMEAAKRKTPAPIDSVTIHDKIGRP